MLSPDPFEMSSDDDEFSDAGGSAELRPAPTKPAKRPRKYVKYQFNAWCCKWIMITDVFADESTNELSLHEKTNMLKEWLCLRLGNEKPSVVRAMAVVINSDEYACRSRSCSIHITAYVQTKNTSVLPLKTWMRDECSWTPVPGGLCGNPEFDADMSKPAPWRFSKYSRSWR